MNNNTIEEIIVEKFNEQYKDKFKNIKKVINDLNEVNGWEQRFEILKEVLRTLPKIEFTLSRGIYRGKFLVYYIISNRFLIREVEFCLKDYYVFVNGKYILVDFKNNIANGENIFKDENIYFILELKKLEDRFVCNTGVNEIRLQESLEENSDKIKEKKFKKIQDKDLIFDDDFLLTEDNETIILDENLSEEEIEEILKNFK